MAFLGNGFTPHKIKSGENEYQSKLLAARNQHEKRNAYVSGIEMPEEGPNNYSQQNNQGSIFNTPMSDPMNSTGSVSLRTSSTEHPSKGHEEAAQYEMGQQALSNRMMRGNMPNLNNPNDIYGGMRRG